MGNRKSTHGGSHNKLGVSINSILFSSNNTKAMIKPTKHNSYSYQTSHNSRSKGFFNIYQARNGAIYIQMGITVTKLTETQLQDLGIDLYSLIDFDHDMYTKHYEDHSKNTHNNG